MTQRHRCSYQRYRQWQYNKRRYKFESAMLPGIIFLFLAFKFLVDIGRFFITLFIVFAPICFIMIGMRSIYRCFNEKRMKKERLKRIQNFVTNCGADITEIDKEKGTAIATIPVISHEYADNQIATLKKEAEEAGVRISSIRIIGAKPSPQIELKKKETQNMARENKGTTVTGFINGNNQRNNGVTKYPGTDFNQMLYDMECLDCGHRYYANGSDIHIRKCPKCQGGKL